MVPGLIVLVLFVTGGVVFLVSWRASNKRVAQQRALAQQQYHAAWQAEQQRQQQAAWQAEQGRAWHAQQIAQRHASLAARFGPATADRIMRGEIWVGQTREQLVESLGQPEDRDVKVLKTKTKEVFKYQRTGANRYALRITLDDDVVVGWEDKR